MYYSPKIDTNKIDNVLKNRQRVIIKDSMTLNLVVQLIKQGKIIHWLTSINLPNIEGANIIRITDNIDLSVSKPGSILYGDVGQYLSLILHRYANCKAYPKLDVCDVLIIDQLDKGLIEQDILIAIMREADLNKRKIPRLILSTGIGLKRSGFKSLFKEESPNDMNIGTYVPTCDPFESEGLIDDILKIIHNKSNKKILLFVPTDLIRVRILDYLEKSNIKAISINNITDKNNRTNNIIDENIVIAIDHSESCHTHILFDIVIDTVYEERKIVTITDCVRKTIARCSIKTANVRSSYGEKLIRMISNEEFNKLKSTNPAEITYLPIHKYIIKLIEVGLSPTKLLNQYISKVKLESFFKTLTSLGLIKTSTDICRDSQETMASYLRRVDHTIQNNGIYSCCKVTPLGRFVARTPLNIHNGSILYRWITDGNEPYEALCLLSIVECYGPNYILSPKRRLHESKNEFKNRRNKHSKTFDKYQGSSELVVWSKIWNDSFPNIKYIEESGQNLINYCRDHLNYLKINEVREIILELLNCLTTLNVKYEIKSFDEESGVRCLLPYLKFIYPDRILNFSNYDGNHLIYKQRGLCYIYDGLEHISKLPSDDNSNIISLIDEPYNNPNGYKSRTRYNQTIRLGLICPKNSLPSVKPVTIINDHPLYNSVLTSKSTINIRSGISKTTKSKSVKTTKSNVGKTSKSNSAKSNVSKTTKSNIGKITKSNVGKTTKTTKSNVGKMTKSNISAKSNVGKTTKSNIGKTDSHLNNGKTSTPGSSTTKLIINSTTKLIVNSTRDNQCKDMHVSIIKYKTSRERTERLKQALGLSKSGSSNSIHIHGRWTEDQVVMYQRNQAHQRVLTQAFLNDQYRYYQYVDSLRMPTNAKVTSNINK